jgi:NADPH:quinone reductase
MGADKPSKALQLRSLVKPEGTVEVSLEMVAVPEPGPNQVVVRVEAAPLNPSDLGLLLAGADISTAAVSGPTDRPVLTATIPAAAMTALAGRMGLSMAVGNEGAGTVVDAGSSDAAQALLGKIVAIAGGAMYSQYRCLDASQCLELPDGTTSADGASSFVNPLTVLGMVETMRQEGHTALVHTAAASNLGRMLIRLCREEQVPLVNIVRKSEQEEILRSEGAQYVCDSTASTFMADLTEALVATSATLAFDAIGGGKLAGQILKGMEAAATSTAGEYSRYGSTTYKQVYIYGGLDRGPTEFDRNFGMAWGIGGWLLTPFLQKIGPEAMHRLQQRVAAGLTSTFASSYTKEVSLAEVLHLDAVSVYAKQSTGEKYLINPTRATSLSA